MRWLDKIKLGLKKTAQTFAHTSLKTDDWEDALIQSDVGVTLAQRLVSDADIKSCSNVDQVRQVLIQKMTAILTPVVRPLTLQPNQMTVILMVGVNGAGKTTTIGKMAHQFYAMGKKVAVVAGDTFRSGAVAQLKKWADHMDFYSGSDGADPASVIFDALQKAKSVRTDVVFVDTAGRLQNRSDLMEELKKIVRVIHKVDVSMPHETILVLDATVGQNAINQVKIFAETCALTGLIMTKLDGSAKGGILLALADQFHLPIYAIGLGEKVDDLNAFQVSDYVQALLGANDSV